MRFSDLSLLTTCLIAALVPGIAHAQTSGELVAKAAKASYANSSLVLDITIRTLGTNRYWFIPLSSKLGDQPVAAVRQRLRSGRYDPATGNRPRPFIVGTRYYLVPVCGTGSDIEDRHIVSYLVTPRQLITLTCAAR